MAKILGIIGGGQLGMMLTEAAKKIPNEISKVIVLDPTKNCPAAQVGADQIIADFHDEKAIKELAQRSDLITYEIESGNSDALKKLESTTPINPSPETLRIIQDKLLQKEFLSKNNIPVGDFVKIDSISDLENYAKHFGFPNVLKARRDSYDGRGNFLIKSENQIQTAYEYFTTPVMLEKFIEFKMEVSVIACRSITGEILSFPVVENIHEDNILKITLAPARLDEDVKQKCQEIARNTMSVLKGAGVFGIEMFVTKKNEVLINEIAPRVHNSGHHTLQSSKTSQFEQHLRAILGLKLGSTDLVYPTIMYNILGPKDFTGPYEEPVINHENIFLKMYGKKLSKPKRKLGHVNFVDKTGKKTPQQMLEEIEKYKGSLQIKPKI